MVVEYLYGEDRVTVLVGLVVPLHKVIPHPEEAVVVVPGWVSISGGLHRGQVAIQGDRERNSQCTLYSVHLTLNVLYTIKLIATC